MFEKVNPSHPDKLADRIAGAVVDKHKPDGAPLLRRWGVFFVGGLEKHKIMC